jgi:hypothetical protein
MRGRAVFAGVVALARWSASAIDSSAAPPQPKPEEELVKSGEGKLQAGDPVGALADFETANKLTPSYEIVRLIGVCQDQLGHYPEALDAYHWYLWVAPQAMTVTFQEVKRRVDEIERPRADQPEATGVDDTGDICQITPDAPQCANTPAYFQWQAEARAREWSDANKRGVVPALVAAGLALTATTVGTVFGGLALNDHYRYQSSHDASTAAEGSNFAAVSDFGFIAAGALAITSVIAYFKWYEHEWPGYAKRAHPPTLTASPFLTPHTAGAGALLRF